MAQARKQSKHTLIAVYVLDHAVHIRQRLRRW